MSQYNQPFQGYGGSGQWAFPFGGGGAGMDDSAALQGLMGKLFGPGQGRMNMDEFAKSQGFMPGYSDRFGVGYKSGNRFVSQSEMNRRLDRRGGPRLASQLTGSMLTDYFRSQDAADELFRSQREQVAGLGADVEQHVGDINKLVGEQAERLEGVAGGLEKFADQGLQDFETQTKGSRDLILSQIGKAEGWARQAVEGLEDNTNEQVTIAASGITANVDAQLARIMSDPNKTPAQKNEETRQVKEAGMRQHFTQITNLKTNFFNKQADLRMGAAGVSMQGADVIGRFEGVVTGQRNQAQALAQEAMQQGAAVRQFTETLRTAGLKAAGMYKMQGRQAMFDMISQSPRGIISLFAGLSSLLGTLTIPGVSRMRGLELPPEMANAL